MRVQLHEGSEAWDSVKEYLIDRYFFYVFYVYYPNIALSFSHQLVNIYQTFIFSV
jgi:hypothetical protein